MFTNRPHTVSLVEYRWSDRKHMMRSEERTGEPKCRRMIDRALIRVCRFNIDLPPASLSPTNCPVLRMRCEITDLSSRAAHSLISQDCPGRMDMVPLKMTDLLQEEVLGTLTTHWVLALCLEWECSLATQPVDATLQCRRSSFKLYMI